MRKILLLASLLAATTNTFSQSVKEPKDSKEVIIEAYTLGANDQLKEAISTLDQISISDTNYAWSRRIAIELLLEEEKYDQVELICKDMLSYTYENRLDFHIYLIDALIDQGKYEEAKMACEVGQIEYPLWHQIKVQEAKAIYKSGDQAQAEEILKELLKLHVFSAQGHYLLGQIAANDGRVVRAIISLHFAIMSDPSMDHLSECYDLLEKICSNEFSPKTKISAANKKLFSEILELVESGVAKKQAYKSELGIFYALSNQIDLLLKSLEYKADTQDFWMDFYVPFLVKINQEKKIVPYTLAFLKVNNSEVVKGLVEKNKDEINQVIADAVDHFAEAPKSVHYKIDGKVYDLPYRYGSGNNLFAVGALNADEQREGKWTLFNLKGKITAQLNYKAGEYEGKNVWYDDYGNVNQIYHFVEGEITGEVLTHYDETGIRNYTAPFVKGKINGLLTNYYWNGLVKEYSEFKEDKRDGAYFYLNYAGDTIGKGTYKEGELNGPYYEYYADGSRETEMNFVEGARDGDFRVYYRNGQLKKKGQYKEGKEVGKWEYFHDNGQLELFYVLTEKGKSDGPFFELYANGDTSRTGYLKKGQLEGLARDFNSDGNLLRNIWYKKGNIKKYEYFDSSGAVIAAGSKQYQGFDEYGYKFIEGTLKGSKGRIGPWKMYYRNGITSKEWNYENGTEQGECKEYFTNGKLSSKYSYKDGLIDGYVINYHRNGSIESEGWFKEGDRIGEWKEYDRFGHLTDLKYYLNGEMDRYFFEYGGNEKMIVRSFYKSGILHEIAYADTSGNILKRSYFPNGNGKYESPFLFSKSKYVKGELAGGMRHGKFQFFYPNGIVDTEYNYRYGTIQGPYLSNHFSGQAYEKGVYLNGDKEGLWERFYLSGNIRYKRFYHKGKQIGRFYKYYSSGQLKEASAVDENGKEHGMDTIYHQNGTIARIIPMHHGNIHGNYIVYDVFEQPMYKKYYNGDEFYAYSYLKGGKWIEPITLKEKSAVKTFYDNGKPAHSYQVKNGRRDGEAIVYYSNGKLWEKEHYKDGMLDGSYESYYENGQLEVKCTYIDGEEEGSYVAYEKDGKLIESFNYVNGSKHGEAKYYEKGKLKYIVQYFHGYVTEIKKI